MTKLVLVVRSDNRPKSTTRNGSAADSATQRYPVQDLLPIQTHRLIWNLYKGQQRRPSAAFRYSRLSPDKSALTRVIQMYETTVDESEAAAVREERDRAERGEIQPDNGGNSWEAGQAYAQHAAAGALATPVRPGTGRPSKQTAPRRAQLTPRVHSGDELNLTPIPADTPASADASNGDNRHLRCPFCVNHRMLRSIKEAVEHIAQVMNNLVTGVERRFGLNRHSIASHTVFMSHETFTPARGGSASAEVAALRQTFGPDASPTQMPTAPQPRPNPSQTESAKPTTQ